ncbi:hypothetical protein [Halomonas sp. 18071143]|uniref:hypothetical protein n=1 Tax=unclassified Halomonas TaxID=2609666 RepID=UPI001E624151|nr:MULTISPECIES: hypothetical protein [unclassified Halomonas]
MTSFRAALHRQLAPEARLQQGLSVTNRIICLGFMVHNNAFLLRLLRLARMLRLARLGRFSQAWAALAAAFSDAFQQKRDHLAEK